MMLMVLLHLGLYAPNAWQIGLAVLLNIALLAGLWWWARQLARKLPPWLWRLLPWALGFRLVVSLLSAVYPSADVIGYEAYSRGITMQLWADPVGWLHTLSSNEFVFRDWNVVFYGMSNTFFFHKVLSVFNLLSLNINALNASYLTLFCFVGCLQLVRVVGQLFPEAQPGAALAFLLWPTVAFWTSIFTKESVLLGSGAWLVALAMQLLYGPAGVGRSPLRLLAGIGLLAWLHFGMRYFFAAPLLGVLLGLGVVRVAQQLQLARRRWVQAGLLLLVLGAGAWLVPQLSSAFTVNKFTSQLTKVYTHHLNASQNRPHFEYPDLVPTGESVLAHMPLAVVNALARPLPGESIRPLYLAASIENALLLGLIGWALWAASRGNTTHALPFALAFALLLYCVAIAILLGLTTPNLGTLNRYRSAMLPYLLLVLLQHEYATRALRRLGLA